MPGRLLVLVLSATISCSAILLAPSARATETAVDAADFGLVPWSVAAPPPLTLPTLARTGAETLLEPAPVGLDALRDRLVVVHFFATWCEPCRDELASLSRLAADRADLAVVAVDVGEVPVRVRRFLDAAPVGFPVLIDADRQAAAAWGVRALPTSFVLGPGLAPRLRVVGDLDWTTPAVGAALDAALTGDAAFTAASGAGDGFSATPQRDEKGEEAP